MVQPPPPTGGPPLLKEGGEMENPIKKPSIFAAPDVKTRALYKFSFVGHANARYSKRRAL